MFLQPVLGESVPPEGPIVWLASAIPVVTLATFVVVHAYLPTLSLAPRGRVFRTHALHGFYLGAIADRLVDAIWTSLFNSSTGASRA
jgi:hypothetical protein